MLKATKLAFATFGRDERGAIAIIFALTAMVLLLVGGLAIDVGRAVHANTKIRAAIDAAALAAAKGLRLQNLTPSEAQALATKMFNENFANGGGGFATVKAVDVLVDQSNFSVEVKVDAEVPTTLGKLAGISSLPIPKSGTAIFEAKDIEVSVQLDVTGSMSGKRMADLKDATKTLVDILIPDTGTGGQKIRIGYAPYSAGVNAGPFADDIAGGVAASGGCVYERRDEHYQATDNYPSGDAVLKTLDELPGWANKCPSAQILPLTDDKALLKSTVDSYWPTGTTAGHLGTAFSWYLLAPNWASIWPTSAQPANYKDGKTIKVAILMTDGEYNTAGGIISSGNIDVSSDFAEATCTEMKAKGIVVYTVGFMLNVAKAKEVMKNCATSSTHAYLASDGDALKLAFKSIAENIANLRLAN
jgi:Flp pilus assembly protein TadG